MKISRYNKKESLNGTAIKVGSLLNFYIFNNLQYRHRYHEIFLDKKIAKKPEKNISRQNIYILMLINIFNSNLFQPIYNLVYFAFVEPSKYFFKRVGAGAFFFHLFLY